MKKLIRKKAVLSLVVICVFTTSLFARTQKIDGQIITINGSINVIFEVPFMNSNGLPDYRKLQSKVIYYDSMNKKRTLMPDTVTEIRFSYLGKTIRMISLFDALSLNKALNNSTHVFLKLEAEGKVNIFSYFYIASGGSGFNPATGVMNSSSYKDDMIILQKPGGSIWKPEAMSFKKDIKAFFSDCTALIEKIDRKEFERKDTLAIAEFYNAQCN
jgi:hypothetical protein